MADASQSGPAFRDRWQFRVLVLAVVLGAALLAARSCASGGDVTQEEAVAIAIEQLDFKPECKQVRFYRAGINSEPLWAVSLWTLDRVGAFKRVSVVQVSARTGTVVAVDRSRGSPYTKPQCVSPA